VPLKGKGYFMWQVPKCDGGDPARIAARSRSAGLTHVLIKIADGANWAYNYDPTRRIEYIPPVADALRGVGISVWGWHYVRGDDPLGEARLAIQRMRSLRLDGYVIDAEKEYKEPGKKVAAQRFMAELRAGLPNTPIGLSTYRYPQVHYQLPYAQFLERCDFAMPQVYFEFAHDVEQQLERSVAQYQALQPSRPIIVTGPTYNHNAWRPSAGEVVRFLTRARQLGLGAANFWAYDFATRSTMLDLWEAVASFDWPTQTPVADMPERLVGRLNQKDPSLVAGLYLENAAHVTPERTVLGRPAVQHWYEDLFQKVLPNGTFQVTGKSGSGTTRQFTWSAISDRGSVVDGNDTLGLAPDGNRILYHYTSFSLS
jgi:hypothetical protein